MHQEPPTRPEQPDPAPGERRPRLVRRLEAQRALHRQRNLVVRALAVVAGATVLVAGLAMLLLPGPALVVIPIGLALLSLEFAWAARLMEIALERAERARRTATETSRAQQAAAGIAIAVAAGAAVSFALVADVPYLPF